MSRQKTRNKIVVISYDSGQDGSVTCEWLSDKLTSFACMEFDVTLVTNFGSPSSTAPGLRVVRIPSISARDLGQEIFRRKTLWKDYSRKSLASMGTVFLKGLLWLPGLLFDKVFRSLAGSHSDGKWSWILFAVPALILQVAFLRPWVVFSTGGPSSAHLAAAVVRRVLRIRTIVELQDPFIGSEMNLSRRAAAVLGWLERFIAHSVDKVALVTELAAARTRDRVGLDEDRVMAIYPGSHSFRIDSRQSRSISTAVCQLSHIGTLYGSRNLDLLFQALDNAIMKEEIPTGAVRVANLGANYALENYTSRADFYEKPVSRRLDALSEASLSDFLLLIQHTDSRSDETIPYKFYDYLNLNLPIVALVRNRDLAVLIQKHGGYTADPRNVSDIQIALVEAFNDWRSGIAGKGTGIRLDALNQARLLLQ